MSTINDIAFSENDFHLIADIAKAKYGLQIARNKKYLLHARIAKRMRILGMSDVNDYMLHVSNLTNETEQDSFLSLLTTNTTSFFREPHHFDFLANVILGSDRLGKLVSPIRIWSAGCSFGHEPYSIAATTLQALDRSAGLEVKITATDVDSVVLEKGRRGSFASTDFARLTANQQAVLTDCSSAADRRIRRDVKNLVQFERLNLVDDFHFAEPFDFVFCRNVVIYFSRETQQQIWRKFLTILKPGGYLFLGQSERLTGPVLSEFESVGQTIYRRRED